MKIVLLLTILLVAAVSFAAQKISIPVGVTNYGPFSVSILHKKTDFSFDSSLWTDPNSTLIARVEDSIDKGTTWAFACGNDPAAPFRGSSHPNRVIIRRLVCQLRPNATHIRGTTTVTGSEVILKAPPNFGGKP